MSLVEKQAILYLGLEIVLRELRIDFRTWSLYFLNKRLHSLKPKVGVGKQLCINSKPFEIDLVEETKISGFFECCDIKSILPLVYFICHVRNKKYIFPQEWVNYIYSQNGCWYLTKEAFCCRYINEKVGLTMECVIDFKEHDYYIYREMYHRGVSFCSRDYNYLYEGMTLVFGWYLFSIQEIQRTDLLNAIYRLDIEYDKWFTHILLCGNCVSHSTIFLKLRG